MAIKNNKKAKYLFVQGKTTSTFRRKFTILYVKLSACCVIGSFKKYDFFFNS